MSPTTTMTDEASLHIDGKAGGLLFELADHLDAMLAYWNANEVCMYANNAYRAWFGKSKQDMMGITLSELLGPLYELNLPYIRRALAGNRQVFERAIPTPDGTVRHSLATYVPHVVEGKVAGMFVHVADVSPLKKLEEQLRLSKAHAEELATRDFLTGLPNRVRLYDCIKAALEVSAATSKMAAIFSIDADNLKKINDTHGHAAGDKFLIEFATRLENAMRAGDTVMRIGGDEFIVVAPAVGTREQVEAIGLRILDAMREPFALGNVVASASCSIGVALSPGNGDDADALISNSDLALYRAKSEGKDRLVFAS